MSLNPVIAEISRSALRHNLGVVRKFASGSKVLAMIKANGYGHDAVEVAKTLSQTSESAKNTEDTKRIAATAEPKCADAFGVARINEAISLREAGIKANVVLMEGCFSPNELVCASEHEFQIVIHNQQQLEQLLSTALIKPISVWIKIDTGMGRVGFQPNEINSVFVKLTESANVLEPVTCMTHFACADHVENTKNQQQLALFNTTVEEISCELSCANSAAIVANKLSHFDWVRPGIMLYGSSPINNSISSEYGLKPVMSLKSIVIAVKKIKTGDTVGYGARWTADKDTNVAVIAMGYGDGYPRNAKDGTPVMINGELFPLAGRVSMDMITVDIGDNDKIKMGDTVILWGHDNESGQTLPAETVASHADTISYEMFCNLASRVEKRFVD